MALSVGSPRPAVSGHPTRRSSDFPPRLRVGAVARPPCTASIVPSRTGLRHWSLLLRARPWFDEPVLSSERSPPDSASGDLSKSSPRTALPNGRSGRTPPQILRRSDPQDDTGGAGALVQQAPPAFVPSSGRGELVEEHTTNGPNISTPHFPDQPRGCVVIR